MAEKQMPISGFPEFRPADQLVAAAARAHFSSVAELYGFRPLETRSVERLGELLAKGQAVEKEMYVLARVQGPPPTRDKQLGLHFDLTVPLARYVAEHHHELVFPYRRYQVQPAWRGERPQEGRYREFVQADLDIIGEGDLALSADAEVLAVVSEVVESLPLPPITLKVSSRPFIGAVLDEAGMPDPQRGPALIVVDKVDKIGFPAVEAELAGLGVEPSVVKHLEHRLFGASASEVSALEAAAREAGDLGRAAAALLELMEAFQVMTGRALQFGPHLVRGLDYYTGMVMESSMEGWERLGSVCSGGRYDSLVTLKNKRLPGVGASIGLSRILVPLSRARALLPSRQTPTVALVVTDRARHRAGLELASLLRSRGIATEVGAPGADAGTQLRYATRLGIPYCWFHTGEVWEVRDLEARHQQSAEPETWVPAPDKERISWQLDPDT